MDDPKMPAIPTLKQVIKKIVFKSRFEDGLYSSHIAAFFDDPRFARAYSLGESTGSWHGAKLRWRVYTCCWAAEHALSLPGDFVECGVNRGGFARAIIDYVGFDRHPRDFYLLDTFCGDPQVAKVNQNDYSECFEDAKATFAPFANVHLIRGRIPSSLPQVPSSSVAFLSIDLNNPLPEVASLRYFWPKLSSGAIAVLDDYAYSVHYAPQKAAIDSLGRELGFTVMTLPTGQGLIIKSGAGKPEAGPRSVSL